MLFVGSINENKEDKDVLQEQKTYLNPSIFTQKKKECKAKFDKK